MKKSSPNAGMKTTTIITDIVKTYYELIGILHMYMDIYYSGLFSAGGILIKSKLSNFQTQNSDIQNSEFRVANSEFSF